MAVPTAGRGPELSQHQGTTFTSGEFGIPRDRSHHHAKYRPMNSVPRQRSFLRLITAQPHLAKHVKSLTWTLVWRDSENKYDRSPLLEDVRETWNVFVILVNVTHLDTASIHDVWDVDLVRENLNHLFPGVTDLRLLGWMHSPLVKDILNTVDATKLQRSDLTFGGNQGALPDGRPINLELPSEFAPTARRMGATADELIVDDDLFNRQETGRTAIFPGPMWLPLRLLAAGSLDSLRHVHIAVPYFDLVADIRNYHTVF